MAGEPEDVVLHDRAIQLLGIAWRQANGLAYADLLLRPIAASEQSTHSPSWPRHSESCGPQQD